MALNFGKTAAGRTGALLAGTFLLGALGASFVDLAPSTPAQARNLSQDVPGSIQRNAPGFADIVDRVSPAVVSIQVKQPRRQLSGLRGFEGSPFERFFDFDEFEERFGDREETDRDRRRRQFSMGQGSGFLISEDGYVVTNGHVVDGAEEVVVRLQDGEELTAEVVGVDDKTDLALVKVPNDRAFPFVSFAEQETRVGDWVIAVGNPFGLGGSVTAGIVSARGREIGAGPYDDFIQVDAPINRGNSGGPTFNLNGRVVGVNTAIYSPSGGSVGIGFAIPASIARDVVKDLQDDGAVTRGWLGVRIQPITAEIAESIGREEAVGALVAEPQDDSPATDAGIRAGDAILAVDGTTVESPRDLAREISSRAPGETVSITVWRDGSEQTVDVELGDLENAEPVEQASRGDPRTTQPTSDVLGMTLAPADEIGMDTDGLAVVEIDPDSEAATNGIRVGDVILQAGGVDVNSVEDLETGVDTAATEGRQNVLLKMQSGETTRFVAVPVEEARG